MSDDSLFREVDEAVRQEQLKKLWDKYGLWVVCGAILIVVAVGGYKGWAYWQAEKARAAGARFVGGQLEYAEGKKSEAIDVFKSLADEGPRGYRILSRLQLAAVYVKDGKAAEALKIYDALASDSGADKVQQGYARIQAASLRLDTATFDEISKGLDGLITSDNSWHHSARELLGLAAYKAGDTAKAERFFNTMLTDTQTPPRMRERAEMMLSLIVQTGGASAAGAR